MTVEISQYSDLNLLRCSDKEFILTETVDCDGKKIDSIGGFTGELNGNGYEIKNLELEEGLFTKLTDDSIVQNLCISEVSLSNNRESQEYLGVLTNELDNASVNNINIKKLSLNVTGKTYCFGGIAGYCIDSKISNCSVEFEETNLLKSPNYIGGICGETHTGNIIGVCVSGDIDAPRHSVVGGAIGSTHGTYSVGPDRMEITVSLNNTDGKSTMGGLIGEHKADNLIAFIDSYYAGEIENGDSTGLLIGVMKNNIIISNICCVGDKNLIGDKVEKNYEYHKDNINACDRVESKSEAEKKIIANKI